MISEKSRDFWFLSKSSVLGSKLVGVGLSVSRAFYGVFTAVRMRGGEKGWPSGASLWCQRARCAV